MSENTSSQAHVARGATFMFIQGFLSAAFGVIYVWFLLNTEEITGQLLFTESDLGIYTLLSFILTLSSTLGIFALGNASVRHISYYLAKGEENEAKSVITRVLQVSAITSSIIAFSLLILGGVLSIIFASSVLIFQLLSLCSVIQIFYFQTQSFLQGLQRIREIAIIGIFYTIVQYLVSLFLVYSGYGIIGPVIGWLCALLLSCSTSLLITFRHLTPSKHAHKLKPLLIFSFPIYASAILTFIVNWVDQIMLFPFRGTDALGVYNLAVRASVVPNLISVAIVTALFPKLSELYSNFGVGGLRDAFKASTRYAAFLGFPVSLMVAILAYPIIALFAPASFLDAVIPLAILCMTSLPATLGSAIIPTFYTLKRTKTASLIMGFSIGLQAVLVFVFLGILNLRLTSAALSSVAFSRFLAAVVGFTLGAYILWRFIKVEFDREAIWKAALASIVMVLSLLALELSRAILEPLSYQFLVLRIRHLPIYATVGAGVYLLSLIVLKAVKKRDIELLHDFLPKNLQWIAGLINRIVHAKR